MPFSNITTSQSLRRKTRIVCVSDTHGASPHNGAFKLPKGDVLIHAGDLSNQGSYSELKKTVEWIKSADYEVKIVIAGNHDITLDAAFYAAHGAAVHSQSPQDAAACLNLFTDTGILYLEHASADVRLTSPSGPQTTFKVFGSPYSPTRGTWGFSYPSCPSGIWDDSVAERLWSEIPLDADVVVTHGPMMGHCDASPKWGVAGCAALQKRLWEVRPGLAVCGHVHEGRGAEVVRWGREFPGREERVVSWIDPGLGSKKMSLVDLTGRKGMARLDNDLSHCKGVTERGSQVNHVSFSGTVDGETKMSRMHHGRVGTWQGREGRKETCVVNAAIMARSHGMGAKRFNQPIVVDIDLPVWREEMSLPGYANNTSAVPRQHPEES